MAASSDSPDLVGHGGVEHASAAESPGVAGPAQPSGARPASVRGAGAPQPRPGSNPPLPARRSRWVVGLLALALVLALLWGFSQGRYAEQLAAEVASLRGELSQVGAERDALRAHLERVRVGVDDVAGRMLTLRELAHADPLAAAEVGAEAFAPDADEAFAPDADEAFAPDGDEEVAPDTAEAAPDAAGGADDAETGEEPLERPAARSSAVDF